MYMPWYVEINHGMLSVLFLYWGALQWARRQEQFHLLKTKNLASDSYYKPQADRFSPSAHWP